MENVLSPAYTQSLDLGALFTPKVAISYLRVSTRKQAQRGGGDDEGYSIPAQREANKKKAMELGAVIVKEFIDRGASAKVIDRKYMQDMLDYVRNYEGKIDFCIIHKVDRLARNRFDDGDITRLLQEHGIRLVSTTESIDETPSGMLLHGILATVAEFTSRNLSTEALKGMKKKVGFGGTVSKAPLGYINVHKVDELGREYRTVELDEERAPFVRQAFELYATGEWTVNDLAAHLALRGFDTRATPKIPSKPMDKGALNKLLVNPYYTGQVLFHGALFPGRHESLVDTETWQKVQDILTSHINGERTRQHPHFLKSSVYCGSCGERLLIQYAKSRSGIRYPYFSCAGRHGRRNDCKQKSILIEQVERQVEVLYDTISFSPEFRKELETWLHTEIQKTSDKFESERQELEREKDKLERKQRKLLEAHYADAIPIHLLKEEQTAIADAVSAIDRQLQLHTTRFCETSKRLNSSLIIMEDCGETYRTAPDHIKRAFNQALFEKIYVTPDDNGACEVKPLFAEPYGLIFGQEAASEAETEAEPETKSPANLRSLSELSRQFNQWRNRRSYFFGGGFSNRLLVGHQGLEPRTDRL